MLQAIVRAVVMRVTRVELSRGVGQHGQADDRLSILIKKMIVLINSILKQFSIDSPILVS